MSWFRLIFVLAFVIGAAARADGPLPQLSDPLVLPAPVVIQDAPQTASGPLSATGTARGLPQIGIPSTLGGYPVNIAWDHVAVGAAILGVMYMLGSDASASGTF